MKYKVDELLLLENLTYMADDYPIISILEGKGKISKKEADEKAEQEYEKFKMIQDKNFVSDFDELILETESISRLTKKQ